MYAKIASAAYGNPAKDMFIIGVTGTDGKTTTCNIIHHLMQRNFGNTAMISTATIKIGERTEPNTYKMTSLDPFKMWRLIETARDSWCRYLVLEVASHAIHQHRFENIDFDMAVLTNITPEHLDYHKTMDAYANVKFKLFQQLTRNKKPTKYAVLPKDDEYGKKRAEDLFFDKMLTYSINTGSMIRWEKIHLDYNKTTFSFTHLWKETQITSPLPGTYNVYNTLAAASVALLLWVPQEKVAQDIAALQPVVGRMEPVSHNWVRYFVDFAHTPNALKSALEYINAIKWNGRSILVFGAPWNRDKFKRPEMWKLADNFADIVIVTDDDPDTEPRLKIIKDITAWIKRELWDTYMILPERETALRMACEIAQANDIVLFAWKGHESVQLTNEGRRPRNDKKKLEEILQSL